MQYFFYFCSSCFLCLPRKKRLNRAVAVAKTLEKKVKKNLQKLNQKAKFKKDQQ